MLSATSTDLASCPRCTGPVRLTLDRFRHDVEGTPFAAFLAHHLKAYRREEIEAARRDAWRSLSPPLREQADDMARDLAGDVADESAWSRDTARVLDRVAGEGAARARSEGVVLGQAEALDLFEAVVLRVVLRVDGSPDLRSRLLAAQRGALARFRWAALSAVVGIAFLAWGGSDLLQALGWTLLALAVLPPLAVWIRETSER